MKLTGGNLGHGSARFTFDGTLLIKGEETRECTAEDVEDIETEEITNKEFGCVGFVIGAIILTLIGLFALGVIGAAIGFVLAIACSFYTETKCKIKLRFTDGRKATLEGSRRDAKDVLRTLATKR